MNKKIIAICGIKGSGKDTIADMLIEIGKSKGINVGKMAFADRLKDTISVLFNLPRDMLAGFTKESREWREQPLYEWSKRLAKPITPRFLLQFFGTDLLRDKFYDKIWIDCLLDSAKNSDLDIIIVTDCRYENEIASLAEKDAKFIEIKRNTPDWYYDVLNDKYPENVHKSEYSFIKPLHDLTKNYIEINNNGTLEDLHNKIIEVYEQL